MNILDRMYDRAEREIELIENDESLSEQEKREAIKEIRAEFRELAREYEHEQDNDY